MDILDKQKFIFGGLFFLSNKLQAIGDKILAADDMTTRQWLLTVAIAQFGNNPPTLNDVAEAMSSSHQNVKQLALKLEKKGFLSIEKDEHDGRVIRLKLMEKSYSYWDKRKNDDIRFITDLFKDLNNEEINSFYDVFNKLCESVMKK